MTKATKMSLQHQLWLLGSVFLLPNSEGEKIQRDGRAEKMRSGKPVVSVLPNCTSLYLSSIISIVNDTFVL